MRNLKKIMKTCVLLNKRALSVYKLLTVFGVPSWFVYKNENYRDNN